MKTLLLLRHAKSSWKDETQTDFERPLNDRGKQDAPRVGQVLDRLGLRPQLVLSSSAKRAKRTAAKLIEASGSNPELRLLDEFYLAPPDTYLRHLRRLPDDLSCVLLVGHNPGLEELVAELTGKPQQLPTAALVHLEVPVEQWRDLVPDRSAKLISIWRPGDEQEP